MASILRIGGKWRALVRKQGQSRCSTFTTKPQAVAWAAAQEREIDELKAKGHMPAKGTLGDVIDRYTRELYPLKPWGRSKTADLKLLKVELGDAPVATLSHERLVSAFRSMHKRGAGGVSVSQRCGYLLTVLSVARDVWRLNVPLEAARSARKALVTLGLISKGKVRNRRVSDAELGRIARHIARKESSIPIEAILWFSVASAMRISETCRLQWQDLDEVDKTIIIKDRKHPSAKIGNHQVVPLLNVAGHDAFAIATAQPRGGKRIFPCNPKTISAYFTRAVDELGIEDLRLHDLRHEAISRLFEAGYRIEQVSIVSGHRDWGMLRRYTHLRAVDLHRERVA